MRVIAGTARGQRLEAPRGAATRPTSDRVKEALFSSLQHRLRGARVLDLYAGSGALGIEALSRGAAHATFVERGSAALRALGANLAATRLADQATVARRDVHAALRTGLDGGPFDIVLIDPPYDTEPGGLGAALALLPPLLDPGAIVVVELGRRGPAPDWPAELLPRRARRYGDTVLHEAGVAPITDQPGQPPLGEEGDGP